MGKKSRNTSGSTAADAARSDQMMNNQLARNPMHTREQGQNSVAGLINGFMENVDGFVDKMDDKVAGIFGDGVNPAREHFMSRTGTQPVPGPASDRDIALAMQPQQPQQQPQVAPQAVPPGPAGDAAIDQAQRAPDLPSWAQGLHPKAQEAIKSLLAKKGEQAQDSESRRDRAEQFLGLDMNRRRGAGRKYDL